MKAIPITEFDITERSNDWILSEYSKCEQYLIKLTLEKQLAHNFTQTHKTIVDCIILTTNLLNKYQQEIEHRKRINLI